MNSTSTPQVPVVAELAVVPCGATTSRMGINSAV